MKTILLGGGCFWCTEAVFQIVPGVHSVISGYAGGHTSNPQYDDVCNGDTGHAEVVKLEYSPETVSLGELLELFFKTHDPTSLNKQGNDVGTQYKSVIFYQDNEDEIKINVFITQIQAVFSKPIVTERRLLSLEKFYAAEDYHQNYYNKNPLAGYCQYIVAPKISKSREWVEHNEQTR